MRIRFLTPILLAAAAIMPAQDKDVTILPYPYYEDAKRYLNLSDAQSQSLDAIVRNRNQAQQGIWTQTAEKNRQLQQLLESGTGSATQIGQLLIDIRNLEKQIPTLDGPYRAQALNVLTADQKTKLAKLDEALKLQATASQAAMLLLLEYPSPIGLPRPVDFGGGNGSSISISAVPPVNRRQ
jgi:hypothetical protein